MLRGLSGERDGGECNRGLVEGKHRGILCAGVEQLNNCCGALVENLMEGRWRENLFIVVTSILD